MPTIYVLEQNKKIIYTPVNPNFTILKWDVRGSTLHGHVMLMVDMMLQINFTHYTFHVRTRIQEIHKVQSVKYALTNLVIWFVCVNGRYHSLKLIAYRPIHTDEPNTKLHFLTKT